jgi:hypothetical protein
MADLTSALELVAEVEKLRAENERLGEVDRLLTLALVKHDERVDEIEKLRAERDVYAAQREANRKWAVRETDRAERAEGLRDELAMALMKCSAQVRQRDADPEGQLKWIERISEEAIARYDEAQKETP